MDRNYCFRRKRHSYAACDAALEAIVVLLRRQILGYIIYNLASGFEPESLKSLGISGFSTASAYKYKTKTASKINGSFFVG